MISKEVFQHYTLGIEAIDDEHWAILSLIDKICSLSKDEAEISMNKIITLWNEHSNNVEIFLKEIEFPYIEYHMQEHKTIANKLEKLKERISDTNLICKFSASDLIRDIYSHIDHHDLQIPAYINSLKRD